MDPYFAQIRQMLLNIRARYTLTLLKGKRSVNVQFASKKCLRSAMGSNFYLKLFIIKFSETFCNIKFKCKKKLRKKRGGERLKKYQDTCKREE